MRMPFSLLALFRCAGYSLSRFRVPRFLNDSCRVAVTGAVLALLTACTALPDVGSRPIEFAPTETEASCLTQRLIEVYGEDRVLASGPAESGFLLLKEGPDALEARLTLARKAEYSLDVQAFELLDQTSSRVLLAHLLEAADRGVQVRLLVDDWGNDYPSAWLASLATHDNIEVRIFNPFPLRPAWRLNYLTHFARVHRRMHNKAFVADNQVGIIGGRNTGDAYYEASPERIFLDLDVLTLGSVTRDISGAFDLYWNHQLASEASRVSLGRYGTSLNTIREEFASGLPEQRTSWQWDDGDFIWAPATLYVDDPGKILRPAGDITGHLMPRLLSEITPTQHEALFVTPYFVPGEEGTDILLDLIDRGIEIDLLTNSLAANNMPIVHSGYAPYRRELLEAGIRLWEVQPTPWSLYEDANDEPWQSVLTEQVTLHAKVWVFDRERVFIGSVNMDPRSFEHNTEIGLLIESPELAAQILDWMEPMKNRLAWRVVLEENGDKLWVEEPDVDSPGSEATAIANYDPDSSWWQRFRIGLYTLLPIEFLL
ncbi:phospholipase D family protein [Natronospirillum operosum]|nr:phospholipase D family protein [Natronospirillum operosum]